MARPVRRGPRLAGQYTDNTPVDHPRIPPDGTTLAWTSTRDGAPEVHTAPLDGGPATRLTHWGSRRTQVRGWTPEGHVLALSTTGQPSPRRTWARADASGPAPTPPTCAATLRSTASTPGTPPPTAPVSSTPAPAASGSSTTSTAAPRAPWTSASAVLEAVSFGPYVSRWTAHPSRSSRPHPRWWC